MSMLNLATFDAMPLQTEPCDYLIVPGFVKPQALAGLNADFPAIDAAGHFPFDDLSCGPRFKALVDEMTVPDVCGMDLDAFPPGAPCMGGHSGRAAGGLTVTGAAPYNPRPLRGRLAQR